jgi:hypothetical protein
MRDIYSMIYPRPDSNFLERKQCLIRVRFSVNSFNFAISRYSRGKKPFLENQPPLGCMSFCRRNDIFVSNSPSMLDIACQYCMHHQEGFYRALSDSSKDVSFRFRKERPGVFRPFGRSTGSPADRAPVRCVEIFRASCGFCLAMEDYE